MDDSSRSRSTPAMAEHLSTKKKEVRRPAQKDKRMHTYTHIMGNTKSNICDQLIVPLTRAVPDIAEPNDDPITLCATIDASIVNIAYDISSIVTTSFHKIHARPMLIDFWQHLRGRDWTGYISATHRILLCGLATSGKTTLLYQLRHGTKIRHTIPTIGFNIETILVQSQQWILWDIGGHEKIVPLWRWYLTHPSKTGAILYLIDGMSDPQHMRQSLDALRDLWNDSNNATQCLCILLNRCYESRDTVQVWNLVDEIDAYIMDHLCEPVCNSNDALCNDDATVTWASYIKGFFFQDDTATGILSPKIATMALGHVKECVQGEGSAQKKMHKQNRNFYHIQPCHVYTMEGIDEAFAFVHRCLANQ